MKLDVEEISAGQDAGMTAIKLLVPTAQAKQLLDYLQSIMGLFGVINNACKVAQQAKRG